MLPTLLVAVAVTAPGAPIPRDAVPNTTGPAPRVVAVKADGNGAVWITAQVWEKRKIQQQFFVVENGKQVLKQQEVEQNVSNYIHKSLGDFGAKFITADGSALSIDDATRRVKDGATLLVTADGKPIDKSWLRAVAGDTVVMQAEGLAHAHFQYNQSHQGNSPLPTTAAPRLAMFCTDESGVVKVAVNPNGAHAYGNQVYFDDIGGGRAFRGRAVMIQGGINIDSGYLAPSADAKPGPDGKKLLADVKFDAYDVTGKLVPKAAALNRLRVGGLVLLAGDNKFPDTDYLKAFRDDILVLVSGEFVFPPGVPNPYDLLVKTTNPASGPGKPTPPIAAPAIGLVRPAVQLRIAPAVIKRVQVAPAPAAPQKDAIPPLKPAVDKEKPAAKPAEAASKPAVKRD